MIRCLFKKGVPAVAVVPVQAQTQSVRTYLNSQTGHGKFDWSFLDKAPNGRKAPVPHEDLLIANDGRYPPHLKIDMDHPENWPKHFPPFHEARRPDRWPLWRAVLWSAFFFLNVFAFACPRWMIPIVYPNFPWLSNRTNWGSDGTGFHDEVGDNPDAPRSIYVPQRPLYPSEADVVRGDQNALGERYVVSRDEEYSNSWRKEK